MGKPVDWDELYPGRFIKGGEIAEGQKVVVRVSAIDMELLPKSEGSGEEQKGVISFEGMDRKMPLNKTNGLCLKAMFGRDVQAWIGKRIVLYRGEWKSKEGPMPAVRIYGSPDITQNISVEIKLPKRKAYQHTLYAPKQSGTTPPGGAAEQKTGAQ